jgi:hypothetical protein
LIARRKTEKNEKKKLLAHGNGSFCCFVPVGRGFLRLGLLTCCISPVMAAIHTHGDKQHTRSCCCTKAVIVISKEKGIKKKRE